MRNMNTKSNTLIKLTFVAAIAASAQLSIAQTSSDVEQNLGEHQIGVTPSAAQIKGWDIDIRPDGAGLPEGSGDFALGEMTYDSKCSVCHGVFGESAARWPKVAGGDVESLSTLRVEKTVGSYWPYATTLYDYINRAMPFHTAKTLNSDEVYALTGYILYLNDLVDDDFVADKDFVVSMNEKMPNHEGFYFDDRPDSPNTRCMSDCIAPDMVKIHSEAAAIGVTPEDDSDVNVGNASIPGEQASSEAEESSESTETAAAPVEINEAGQSVYNSACGVCHNSGVAGAPKNADKDAWTDRIAKGIETLNDHAINGFNAMPPKGGNMSLSDEEVINAVEFMVQSSQ